MSDNKDKGVLTREEIRRQYDRAFENIRRKWRPSTDPAEIASEYLPKLKSSSKLALPFIMSRSTRKWNRLSPEEKAMKRRLYALNHKRPNKPERRLLELLEASYPSEWAYVGDGQLIIGGKNPDFTNINGKKQLIELFGDYWHKGENPQERVDFFKQYGYKTLIIWSSELSDLNEVRGKIRGFVEEKLL